MNPSKIRDQRMWARWKASGAVSDVPMMTTRNVLGDQRIQVVLTNELVDDVIDEAIGNWTQRHFKKPDPNVKAVLLSYATTVTQKVFAGATPYPDFSPEWKGDISNRVHAILDYKQFKEQQIPVMVDALFPIFGDTRSNFENGMWGYSLAKIASVVGCVAYMVKSNLQPELLLMTPEEANASLLRLAETFSKKYPEKVIVADLMADKPEDVVTEVLLRTNPPDISKILKK